MIYKDLIIAAVKEPMAKYCQTMKQTIGDWQPLLTVSEKILAGAEVRNNEVQPELEFLVEWMRLIMEVTRDGQWDWTSPAVQAVYKNYADSMIYKTFAGATVGIVTAIMKTGQVGTVLEIGTGPGQVTEALCREMIEENISAPIIYRTGRLASQVVGENMRKNFPALSISDFVWNIREDSRKNWLKNSLGRCYCMSASASPTAAMNLLTGSRRSRIFMLMVEDLNLTGKKRSL